jgi:DNA-binding CsgD family transcriptional regulator/tetratricopeptide (TPR) repeat protein
VVETDQEAGEVGLDGRDAAGRALLERDLELTTVAALLDGASGFGRLLAIEGPPGIGKTSLIFEARARGEELGMQILSARGTELEQTFAFGVVRQLFEPHVAHLSDDERTDALGGAAALASPLFEPAQLTAPSADVSLAMLHGLYWLTANVSARKPLLLVIDDLHWCDVPSLRWLAYLLPRIEGLEVAIAVALRAAEPGVDPALLGQVVSDPLANVLRPSPLSPEAAAALVRRTLPSEPDGAFCEACHRETGGNPLLLHELLRAIAAEDLAPVAANVPQLRDLAARAGTREVAIRLSRLPPEATKLAQAVAILGKDTDPHHAAALAGLDEATAAEAAAGLARVDILRPQALLSFVHPVIRAAVYDGLSPLERETGHAQAARLLAEAGAEPERIAMQLLRSPADGNPEVVAALRDAARSARCRGAAESAVAFLRRALGEPPDTADLAEVLLELGHAETLVSGEAAVEHLLEAYDQLADPVQRAETAIVVGRQLDYLVRIDESVEILTRSLDELAGTDDELGRVLEAVLIAAAIFDPRHYDSAHRRLQELRDRVLEPSTPGQSMLLGLVAFDDARSGAGAATEVVDLARRALAEGTLLERAARGRPFLHACIVLAMGDPDEALPRYDGAIAAAHQRGSLFDFAWTKVLRAQALVFRGDLAEAEANAREAMGAYESWGTPSGRFRSVVAAVLCDALVEQGKVDEALAVLPRGGPASYYFPLSRARVLLASGDVVRGLEETRQAGADFEALGGRNPALMPWRSQAAFALLELDQQDEARRLAADELELARSWGSPRALGGTLRVAGLVEGRADGLALLEEAVDVLADSSAKLEHAKARTELGAALRRANRRSQAREHLRRGLELATICGATPLATRAETELLATGARPRRISLSGVESLTPSERRVAEMAAEGPTNREIAQALFVTPKTVEVHLSSVYRKLGISSRSQLADALAVPASV